MTSLMDTINHLRKKLTNTKKLVQKIEEGALPILFCRVRITLTSKLDNNIVREENYWNTDSKVLNIILVSKTL